ncbi:hypothetical protein CBW46_009025 [Paenibacillus xerothermodurans]|uniref:DUF2269 family protein n=1 Tax=Paenibacillus xerothermodurans TaxID=1977292 RepID=A0A2W1P315_PAEXE|nr:hypothetical protein CBW46_009025 [Paenibacillus xerothermodurans]
MISILLYLHVLAAVVMGVYLLFPFLAARITALTGAAQVGLVSALFIANRTGQLALLISLLTGGYLVGKGEYSITWMVLAVVLFLALAAVTGVMGGAMRKALADPAGTKINDHAGRIRSLSLVSAIIFFVLFTIMSFPF